MAQDPKPFGGFADSHTDKNLPRHIGNYSEEWRAVFEQVIAETGYAVRIGRSTVAGYAFGLWTRESRELGPFHDRAREIRRQ